MVSKTNISQTFQWWGSMTTRRPTLCTFYIVMMLLKNIPFRNVLLKQRSFCCWFIISVISTLANATKQLGRYKRQHCLVSTLWLDVARQDGSTEKPNRFGGNNFIVREKMRCSSCNGSWVKMVNIIIIPYHSLS